MARKDSLQPQTHIAARVADLSPSATAEMSEKVRQLRKSGLDIIGLSSGDPNIPTHPAVIDAAFAALKRGATHYGSAAGVLSLRQAIQNLVRQTTGVSYDINEILITPGGKYGVYAALQAIVDPGDSVIILDPSWVSYAPCVQLSGGTPIRVPALDQLPFEELLATIGPRTRAVIVNSPTNPTGRIVSREELEFLVHLAHEKNLWLLFDEVYSALVFEGTYTAMHALEGAKERTIVVNSFSKTYGMTGWRLGYLLAPPSVASAVVKILQHSTYCVPEFVQVAGEAALALPTSEIDDLCATYRHRSTRAAARLNALPEVHCKIPTSTFYLFPTIGVDDVSVASWWLEQAGVATVPGSAFGPSGRGHLRISLTTSDEELSHAFDRLDTLYGRGG